MGGKGLDLDAKVASGEFQEIDVNEPEKPETPEPEKAEEPEEQEPQEPQEPETPEKPETEPKIPPKNELGERRRLQEKVRDLEEENERLKAQPEPEPVRREREPIDNNDFLSPYKPTDESPDAEAYWSERERESGVDRRVLYSQEVTALRVAREMRTRDKNIEDGMEAAVNFALKKRPHAEKYKSEIRDILLKSPERTRTNAGSVLAAVDMVVGRHFADTKSTPLAPKKPLKQGSSTIPPRVASVQSRTPKQLTLTAEQEKWAESMGFRASAWTNEEILAQWDKKVKAFEKSKK